MRARFTKGEINCQRDWRAKAFLTVRLEEQGTIRPKDKVPSPSVVIVRIPIGEYLYRTNARH